MYHNRSIRSGAPIGGGYMFVCPVCRETVSDEERGDLIPMALDAAVQCGVCERFCIVA